MRTYKVNSRNYQKAPIKKHVRGERSSWRPAFEMSWSLHMNPDLDFPVTTSGKSNHFPGSIKDIVPV